jgi:replicative DNA helicase
VIGCVEAEAALLGALLQTNAPYVAHALAGQLEEGDFHDPRHRAVVVAMRQLVRADKPLDPVTVLGELRRSGLERCMTDDRSAGVFLTDLMTAAPTIASAGHYLDIVLEHRVRAEMVRLADRMTQAAEAASLDDVRAVMRDDITALATQLGRLNARQAVAA